MHESEGLAAQEQKLATQDQAADDVEANYPGVQCYSRYPHKQLHLSLLTSSSYWLKITACPYSSPVISLTLNSRTPRILKRLPFRDTRQPS